MTIRTKAAWRKLTPRNIYEAAEWTAEFGRQHNQMSRERLCDHFGNELSTTGKWISQANLPMKRIIAFEQLCGINFVSQYLNLAQGYITVKIPTGSRAEHKDLTELQIFMTEIGALLIKGYDGRENPEDVKNGIQTLIADLAFHQKNIVKTTQAQSELSLENNNA